MEDLPVAVPEMITSKSDMRRWSRIQKSLGKTVALVPTMGFLHDGHLSLIREAKAHASTVVVSIYINPSQFAPNEDLSTYPSNLEGDLEKLAGIGGVSAVFCPENIYESASGEREEGRSEERGDLVSCLEEGVGNVHETWVQVERLSKGLCGKSRPVFFRGVTTVVTKLFNVVEPDVAIFGKKDYQQWKIITRMVRDLDFPINIIGSDIVREGDGLAMSSRNVKLSPQQREKALSINHSLLQAKCAAQDGQHSCKKLIGSVIEKIVEAGGEVDYVEIVDQDNLEVVDKIAEKPVVMCVAAWFGTVRLIDNMEIDMPDHGQGQKRPPTARHITTIPTNIYSNFISSTFSHDQPQTQLLPIK